MRFKRLLTGVIAVILIGGGWWAFDARAGDNCTPGTLSPETAEAITALLSADNVTPEMIYQAGLLLQTEALNCDYIPTVEEIDAQIELTLQLAPLPRIIAASAVGSDVEEALAQIEDLQGDSFNGQLLYNSIEPSLDGGELGCLACHNGVAAPATEGTFTRIEEQRLNDPQFADYTVEQYLVESILHPEAYYAPGFEGVIMPNNFGIRLDAQQLADLVAYLESQDQLLDE